MAATSRLSQHQPPGARLYRRCGRSGLRHGTVVAVWVSVALGVAFMCGGLVMLGPQFWRTWTTRRVDGLSSAAVTAQCCTDAAWVLYGWARSDPAIFLSSAGTCVGNLLIVLALLRAGVSWRPLAAGAALTGGPVAVALLFGPVAVGIVAGMCVVVMFLPQLVLAARTFLRGGSLAGVSAWTWAGHASACLLWMWYAFWVQDWVLLGTEAVLVPVAVAVLAFVVADRLRARRTAETAATRVL